MQTRSQTKKINASYKMQDQNYIKEYDFIYDFDYASKCWKQNKKYVGNGCYKYICQGITKNGKKCIRNALLSETYCKMHL